MADPDTLPLPHLDARRFGARRIPALSDDALFDQCGVRVAFTGREGGISEGSCAALNLGYNTSDAPAVVGRNRRLILEALGAEGMSLVSPKQVHGDVVVEAASASPAEVERAQAEAARGADAVVVDAPGVAALLCFADCTPVVVVSPSGRFAVAHAGWRGVMNGVAVKAARMLARADGARSDAEIARTLSCCNVYIGPHIHAECFEVGEDLADRFSSTFGSFCVASHRHVSMLAALSASLAGAGVDARRIVDAGICTRCDFRSYYSYRASGGDCGRHGAVAFRKEAS